MNLLENIFEEMPDVIPEDPIEINVDTVEISTEPEVMNKEGPDPGPSAGISQQLIDAIKDEWTTIDMYNLMAITADNEGHADLAKIIRDINSEENNHVGMLQKALLQLSPVTAFIADGESEASETLQESLKRLDERWMDAKAQELEEKGRENWDEDDWQAWIYIDAIRNEEAYFDSEE